MVERGIGRGLAAILPPAREQDESLQEIPVDLIDPNPRQPRTRFEDDELRELAESVGARGMLQPVLVRPLAGGRYELIAGERRCAPRGWRVSTGCRRSCARPRRASGSSLR